MVHQLYGYVQEDFVTPRLAPAIGARHLKAQLHA
jgi:hypothetical protein